MGLDCSLSTEAAITPSTSRSGTPKENKTKTYDCFYNMGLYFCFFKAACNRQIALASLLYLPPES